MLLFKQIKLVNFLSFREAELFMESGSHLIEGVNTDDQDVESNGSGKSALFEAVAFAIYGQSPRKSISFEGNGDCSVYISVDVDGRLVEITRYSDHKTYGNKIIMAVNGEDVTAHTIKDTQADIERMIPISYNHFINSIVMPQDMVSPIRNSTPTQRKMYFEEIIGFDWDRLEKVIKVREKELSDQAASLNSKIASIGNKLSELNGMRGALSHDDNIDVLLAEVDVYSKELIDITKIATSIKEEIDSTREMCSSKETFLSGEVSSVRNEIRLYTGLANGVCPTCNRPYDVDKVDEARQKLAVFKSQLDLLNEASENASKLRGTIRDDEVNLEKNRQLKNRIDGALLLLEKRINDAKARNERLAAIDKEIESISASQLQITTEADHTSSEVIKFQKLLELIRPSGELRSYVVETHVNVYNEILSSMTKYIYQSVCPKLEFDDKYRGLHLAGVEYKNMSGGEKKRLDLLLQLSNVEFVSRLSHITSNLLTMDEVFDGLDKKAAQVVVGFVQEYFGERALYVISHRGEIKDLFPKSILIRKEGGESRLMS